MSNSAQTLLQADALECVRGDNVLFEGLSFSLQQGEAVQITGANGSGKTSLLRILCGLSLPESGQIRWRGESIDTVKEDYYRSLTYIGHKSAIKDDLSVVENVYFASPLAPTQQIEQAIDTVSLAGYEHTACKYLSVGQRRRVALAKLFIIKTRLWILDEPLTAIDQDGVEKLTQCFAQHLANGGSLIFTSHQPLPLSTIVRPIALSRAL